MGEHSVRTAYDTVADLYADRFTRTEPEQALDLAVIERFVQLLGGGDDVRPRVLDAGCGTGRLMPVLHELCADAMGVDISPGMIRRARRDHPEFETQVATLRALPFEDDAFDGTFSSYSTIHHSDAELPAVVAELARVTRPGGCVLVAFQSGGGTRDVAPAYRAHGHEIELTRHLRTLEEVVARLTDAGLSMVTRLERSGVVTERDAQALVIARKR